MKRILTTLLISTLVTPAQSQIAATDLQQFIQKYNGPVSLNPIQSAQQFRARLKEDTDRYKFFYEGPDDQGGESLPKEQWHQMAVARSEMASEFLKQQMDLPAEAINIFTLEMMKRFLDEPNSRPAIRELIMTIQGIKFSKAALNELETSQSAYTTMGHGILAGTVAVLAFCTFRPGLCSQLALKANLTDDARNAARTAVPRQRRVLSIGRAAPRAGETTIQKILRGLNLNYGHAVPSAAETVGSAITKKTKFLSYSKLDFKRRLFELGTVALPAGVVVGGGWTLANKLDVARKRGKYEHEVLSPADLEQKYYGALAVLELTCQARQYQAIKALAPQSISDTELASFIVDANQQVLLLGRMAGGLEVYDKTPLDFVTAGTDGRSINVEIKTHTNHTETFSRPCPGAANLGSPISTSLRELESLLGELLELIPEAPAPTVVVPAVTRPAISKQSGPSVPLTRK